MWTTMLYLTSISTFVFNYHFYKKTVQFYRSWNRIKKKKRKISSIVIFIYILLSNIFKHNNNAVETFNKLKRANGRGKLKFIIVIFLKIQGGKSFVVGNCSALNSGLRQNILSQSVNEILANRDIAVISHLLFSSNRYITFFFLILKRVSKIAYKKI